jgi:protein-tyrosine-phosphatase
MSPKPQIRVPSSRCDDVRDGVLNTLRLVLSMMSVLAGATWIACPPGGSGNQAWPGASAGVLSAVLETSDQDSPSALHQARRVLFVCKGNICRSPFAHRLAETVFLSNLEVASGGYYPEPGRQCPAEAVEAAAEMGIDLRPHRSQVLSSRMLEDADVVFVCDEENYLTLRGRYPWAMTKVHSLGVLGDRPAAIIRDPYGGTRSDFRVAYEAINQSLTSALR